MAAALLKHLTVWDGEAVAPANALLFRDGRIEAVGEASELTAGRDVRAIDCAGLTAIPGLIDAHVHLELNPDDAKPPDQFATAEKLPSMAERAKAMVRAGITTGRDLGGGAWLEIEIRDRINRGALLGPRLLCAGQPITSVAGHCHFWGGEAAGFAEAEAVLRRQLEHDVDLIKVMATGGRMTRGSNPIDPQFDLATLTQIVELAASHELPVAAHCHGTEGIRIAAEAGVRTIEHCSWVGQSGWASDYRPEIAATMAERGVWVSPTVSRGWRRFLDNPDSTTLKRIQAAFKDMHSRSIPFIASTDAGIPGVYHHHLPQALPVFAAIAGLTPEAALRTATSAAAQGLGISQATGRLKPGLSADIVLVHGNPLDDLAVLAEPAAVWAGGVEAKGLS